jgi:hypothetical protein
MTLWLIRLKLVHIILIYISFVSKFEATVYEADLIQMNKRSFIK